MSQSRATHDPVPVDLREAAALLLPGHGEISTVAGAPEAVRVETMQGPARVTRWPIGTTAARIKALHELFALRASTGAEFLPSPISAPVGGTSIALTGGRRYDARGWLPGTSAVRDPLIPGEPLPTPISIDHAGAAARAIGALHLAGDPIVKRRSLQAVPLTMLHQQTAVICRQTREDLTPLASTYPPVREWVRASDRIIPLAADAIGGLLDGEERRFVVAHAGLWPEHILFVRESGDPVVSGLVGWNNTVVTSPLLDLAQLVSRTRGWSHDITEAVVENYQQVASLTPLERRSLPLIIGLDLLREGARLLSLYMHRDDALFKHSQYTLIFNALERTLDATDAIIPALGGYDDRSPKRGRKWVYRPKPGQGAPQGSGKRSPRPKPRPRDQ
jgi:hypothetical protein